MLKPLYAAAAVVVLVGAGVTYATASSEPAETNSASAASLAAARTVTKSIARRGVLIEEDPDLGYTLIGSYSKCPRRTHMVSGGFTDFTDGITFYSFPDVDGKEAWAGATIASYGQNPRNFTVSVTCVGRASRFPGGAFRISADAPAAQVPEQLAGALKDRAPR